MKTLFQSLIVSLFGSTLASAALDGQSQYEAFAPDGIPFVVAQEPWQADGQGSHRAVVSLDSNLQNAQTVRVELPWRRPDLRADTKKIVVKDATTDKEIADVEIPEFSNEKACVLFRPTSSTLYYLYYLPSKFRKGWHDARYGTPWNDYLPPIHVVDDAWLESLPKDISTLPQAKVERFESRSEFDAFTPMGLIATEEEMKKISDAHPENPILFTEDRAFPSRLVHQLPVRWCRERGPSREFRGTALRNEYYVWQVGLWAAHGEVKNVQLEWGDLTCTAAKRIIPKEELTCFNLGGTNWDGTPLSLKVDIPAGKVQTLWCGVQIPEDAPAGTYSGQALFSAEGLDPQIINLHLEVEDKVLADRGDSELWRHSRLRWLNSTLGMDDHPVAPYLPMSIQENVIRATDKYVSLAKNGLPSVIRINDQQVLASPMSLQIETDKSTLLFNANNLTLKQEADGLVSWQSQSTQGDFTISCNASMEYDGYMHYQLRITSANEETPVKDVRLVTTYTPYTSEYFMGAGYKGGFRPETHTWDWKGSWDSYWMGNELAGLHTEFLGGTYHGPLMNDYKPAPTPTWSNEGKGRISLTSLEPTAVVSQGTTRLKSGAQVIASTGPCTLSNTPKDFEFALLITPLKPVNSAKHFSERYYHANPDGFDAAAKEGANIANIHHAQPLNPVINYPFIVREPLTKYIKHQHEEGRKVKLYYTIRELTTHVKEVYALKSLNHEIFVSGVGYGIPWQCEHLIDDYKPAWYTELPGETSDAAVVLNGFSRWINYYLEGLRWMLQNYDLDGIYMDDVSFDRPVMKRMRKILDHYHPGSLIDLHSHCTYSNGPMNQYTGFFPYIDRLWFGEGYKYNEMSPDEWFVTFSGIPFGQMSEMLQDGGNRYLGMVYGATARHSYGKFSPAPVWALWKSFGIEEARMMGYWSENCPVKTDQPLVKATAYVKANQTLIALGNFDQTEHEIHLSIDWKALGLDHAKATITAPAVADFQDARTFQPQEAIPLKPKEGWLLLIENKNSF